MSKDKTVFPTNSLYLKAIEYSDELIDEETIRQTDMTEQLYKEMEYMVKKGECINITVNGKVRGGKSTMAIKLGKDILHMLINDGQQPKNTKFSMKNLARDQQEYSKYMRDPNTHNTVIVTDESNELEKGGENSSAEYALNRVFSDIQAGRYVHRVSCSPKETIDTNSDIVLEVIAQNKQERQTHCLLYYKYLKNGYERLQLLGYVNIDVTDIIDNWEDIIKPIFFKERNEKEEAILQEAIKKDFYIEYNVKKYEKMELITKHGVMRPRELDYAEIVLNVVTRLNKTVEYLTQPAVTVKNYIKMEMMKAKMPTSLIGIELATQQAMGVLNLYKTKYKVETDIMRYQKKGSINKVKDLTEVLTEMKQAIAIQLEELNRLKELNEQYHDLQSQHT